MTADPLKGFARLDKAVHDAVAAIDRGDLIALDQLLSRHPRLLRDRLECGEGYFQSPYLLWFVAGNPSRADRLPPNAANVASAIIEAAQREAVASLGEQIDYTLSLVCSGRVSRESGVQRDLIAVLAGAGANLDGAIGPALAHQERDAVDQLLQRGARLTLPVAAALGRLEDVERLLRASDREERQLALAAAAIWGRAVALRALLAHGADPDAFCPPGFHAHGTVLHNAVASGSLDAVEALVEAGARLDIKDRIWNGTPLEWAEHLNNGPIHEYLSASA